VDGSRVFRFFSTFFFFYVSFFALLWFGSYGYSLFYFSSDVCMVSARSQATGARKHRLCSLYRMCSLYTIVRMQISMHTRLYTECVLYIQCTRLYTECVLYIQ